MRLYIKALDHGPPAARRTANIVVAAVLALIVAVPILALAVRLFV